MCFLKATNDSIFHPFFVPSQENSLQHDALGEQMLGLLVSFAQKMDEAGILPEVDEAADNPEDPSVVSQPPGATVKAGPPLPPEHLTSSGSSRAAAAASSCSSGCQTRPASVLTPTSKYSSALPSAPSDYNYGGPQGQTRGRLVCSPEHMKKFLYGDGERPKASATAPTTDSMIEYSVRVSTVFGLCICLQVFMVSSQIFKYSGFINFCFELHCASSDFALRTLSGFHLCKEVDGFAKLVGSLWLGEWEMSTA